MIKPVIIALDVDTRQQLTKLLQQLGQPAKTTIKIGMELFFNQGQQIVQELAQQGYHIFLDLKLHDIPNTVYQGMKQLAQLGITYTTVHALGGSPMISAAKKGLIAGTPAGKNRPKLLAVTELTSISDSILSQEQNCQLPMKQQVVSLAQMAKKAGADGIICSAREVKDLRQQVGANFLYVTPGIRLQQNSHDDQARTATPKQANFWGASALVVGRPITLAAHPQNVYQEIVKEFNCHVSN